MILSSATADIHLALGFSCNYALHSTPFRVMIPSSATVSITFLAAACPIDCAYFSLHHSSLCLTGENHLSPQYSKLMHLPFEWPLGQSAANRCTTHSSMTADFPILLLNMINYSLTLTAVQSCESFSIQLRISVDQWIHASTLSSFQRNMNPSCASLLIYHTSHLTFRSRCTASFANSGLYLTRKDSLFQSRTTNVSLTLGMQTQSPSEKSYTEKKRPLSCVSTLPLSQKLVTSVKFTMAGGSSRLF